jgi:superfamily II DNA helicase RecQ
MQYMFVDVRPPRSLSQYLQEIGRAWRRGQASTAVLYYSKRDIASNLPGMSDDIRDYCNHVVYSFNCARVLSNSTAHSWQEHCSLQKEQQLQPIVELSSSPNTTFPC